jgi:2-polyprenyl-3-methyl-5-hydroxy-6-metoxy-1,4-benzoquinol methylase
VLVGGSGGGPLQARLAAVYLHAPQGRRVLDFGCGTSEFLDAARAAGWSTTGCDFSDEGVAGTRAAGHETRVLDDSFWDWLRGQRFDAIRLNHVIEHLHYPGTQLRDLMQSLRPGGLLHIVTPDPEGPACRLFRRSSLFFEAVHLTLIPPGALAAAAVAAGASAVDVVHEQGTKDLWRSWQLSRGQVENYAAARPEPGHRGQRLALKALARVTRRSDRYHAFVRA